MQNLTKHQLQVALLVTVILIVGILFGFALTRATASSPVKAQGAAISQNTRSVIGGHAKPIPVFPGGYWHPLKHTIKRHGKHFDVHVLHRARRQLRHHFSFRGWHWHLDWVVKQVTARRSTKYGHWHTSLASRYGEAQAIAGPGRWENVKHEIVAHKTLPFMTVLDIRYRRRRARGVIRDRGPYIEGRELDLGPGVSWRLRFSGLGMVRWRTAKTYTRTLVRWRGKYTVKR